MIFVTSRVKLSVGSACLPISSSGFASPRQVRRARETGAWVYLQVALTYLARTYLVTSELAAAARLIEEDSLIAEATGNRPSARPRLST